MDNKEKAQAIITDLFGFHSISLAGKIEKTLDRLDAPEPKKWEPREGYYHAGYVTSRIYPTSFEADLAKPLHLKMDRLVNWLVENCPEEEVKIKFSSTPCVGVTVSFLGTTGVATKLVRSIESGEVEL